jgi:hypothetical protein
MMFASAHLALPSLRSRHAVCHFLLRKWKIWNGSLSLTLRSVRAGMLSDPADYRWRSYGAVIGSKAFVNEAFTSARERFGAKRQDGARRMRGSGKPGVLWSLRDLRVRV